MIESTTTYENAACLAKSNQDLAVFFYDPACHLCADFIPEAVKLLTSMIDQVHVVNARQSPFPPAQLPCVYLYRRDEEIPVVKVGVGPIELVENDFRKFFGKI
jgi:hypothetical protein